MYGDPPRNVDSNMIIIDLGKSINQSIDQIILIVLSSNKLFKIAH